MHNLIVLGSGRSGTSMMTGILTSKNGYYLGDNLIGKNERNPKGNFESRDVNEINEEILARVLPEREDRLIHRFFPSPVPVSPQRWLAQLPMETTFPDNEALTSRIQQVIRTEPYCIKDPRMSYTYSYWKNHLSAHRVICVFRHPGQTHASIKKELSYAPHLKGFRVSDSGLYNVWLLMYSHILRSFNQADINDWLFVEYDQLFEEGCLRKIEDFIQAKVDHEFAESRFNRSGYDKKVPGEVMAMYERLKGLSRK
ncbi:MAG: sulfotransferase [Marinoscillum sp.]|uniref:sulfotransferase n=1 Tax=Marinoscillum sp. TaxID=2024838 RepID=UPI0033031670